MEEKQERKAARPATQRNEKRTAKAIKKVKRKPSSPRQRWTDSDYAKLGLEPAKLKTLKNCTTEIATVGRRTADQTFMVGEQLHIAAGLIEDRTFGKWVSAECDITRQHATTLINIATRLQNYKRRLVEARIRPNRNGCPRREPGLR